MRKSAKLRAYLACTAIMLALAISLYAAIRPKPLMKHLPLPDIVYYEQDATVNKYFFQGGITYYSNFVIRKRYHCGTFWGVDSDGQSEWIILDNTINSWTGDYHYPAYGARVIDGMLPISVYSPYYFIGYPRYSLWLNLVNGRTHYDWPEWSLGRSDKGGDSLLPGQSNNSTRYTYSFSGQGNLQFEEWNSQSHDWIPVISKDISPFPSDFAPLRSASIFDDLLLIIGSGSLGLENASYLDGRILILSVYDYKAKIMKDQYLLMYDPASLSNVPTFVKTSSAGGIVQIPNTAGLVPASSSVITANRKVQDSITANCYLVRRLEHTSVLQLYIRWTEYKNGQKTELGAQFVDFDHITGQMQPSEISASAEFRILGLQFDDTLGAFVHEKISNTAVCVAKNTNTGTISLLAISRDNSVTEIPDFNLECNPGLAISPAGFIWFTRKSALLQQNAATGSTSQNLIDIFRYDPVPKQETVVVRGKDITGIWSWEQ